MYHPKFHSIVKLTEGVKPDPDGYVRLYKDNHPELFVQLHEVGFFDFNISNSGWVVGAHAVVAFLAYGWNALHRGITINKHTHQVHHLNNVSWDNNPENLVYLTLHTHNLVSQVSDSNFVGSAPSQDLSHLQFNNGGRIVKNYAHFVTTVIAKTLTAIKENFSDHMDPLTLAIQKVIVELVPQWISQVLADIKVTASRLSISKMLGQNLMPNEFINF